MANISGANNEKIYSLKKWGGLNEAPDGDTRLKLGEASKMVNWKITRDGNLKRRPGIPASDQRQHRGTAAGDGRGYLRHLS